jgi:hypothetical protein
MSNNRSGRPSSAAPPEGAVVSDKVEAAAAARPDATGGVIGAPSPIVDPAKSSQVDAPRAAEKEEQKKHTWHRVYIDLGPSTDHININGQAFHHGQTATVRNDLLPVLQEVMYNTKMHEMVVKGQASPHGRRLQPGR